LRDLYQEGFDPVLKITEQPGKPGYAPLAENVAECRELQDTDVLVLIYPVWFGTPPAMLKGYLERVIGSGIAFNAGGQIGRPLSKVRLVQISTSASSGPWLSEKGIPGALHTIFDSYIAEVFGAKAAHRLHIAAINEGMSTQHAATSLARVDELADLVCAEANAARWDRSRQGSSDT
jgi:NAD(P)H dehydrogenase (quinone)